MITRMLFGGREPAQAPIGGLELEDGQRQELARLRESRSQHRRFLSQLVNDSGGPPLEDEAT